MAVKINQKAITPGGDDGFLNVLLFQSILGKRELQFTGIGIH
jgi:hypothetical protein